MIYELIYLTLGLAIGVILGELRMYFYMRGDDR
jgi:hypothetical protein